MNKEEYENLINNVRDSLDETTRATQSENFLNLLSSFNTTYDKIDEMNSEIANLKNEKEELLKTNGKLFQQIGFPSKEPDVKIPNKKEENEVINITDIINEKGELI